MAYEFLKKLFTVNEDGTPASMTYDQLEAAIDADKEIKLVNLSEGGYVDAKKFNAKVEDLTAAQKQMEGLNKEIQSLKDLDAEGLQKRLDDLQKKYDTDMQEMQTRAAERERSYAEDSFLRGYKFTSEPARREIARQLHEKNLQMENGVLLGAKVYIDSLIADEAYAGTFVVEEPKPAEDTKKKPMFAGGTGGGTKKGAKTMSLSEKMRFISEHPDTDINSLFKDD